MSTYYSFVKPIRISDLFDGRLDRFGIVEYIDDETGPNHRWLTDGQSCVSVRTESEYFPGGERLVLVRYGSNNPLQIIESICEEFDTDSMSEFEPEFWGFKTQEEWDAIDNESDKQASEEFGGELAKFVRGDPCDIRPGTNGMLIAEIARELADRDASLLLPENLRKLDRRACEILSDRNAALRGDFVDRGLKRRR